MKIWSPHTYLFRKMVWLNLVLHRSKAQLAPRTKNIYGIQEDGANSKVGVKYLRTSKLLILKCKLNFKCKSSSWHNISKLFTNFKNKEELNSIKLGAEQHKSTLGCSLKLSIKLDRVFNFFIYFYKLLKFPLLFSVAHTE